MSNIDRRGTRRDRCERGGFGARGAVAATAYAMANADIIVEQNSYIPFAPFLNAQPASAFEAVSSFSGNSVYEILVRLPGLYKVSFNIPVSVLEPGAPVSLALSVNQQPITTKYIGTDPALVCASESIVLDLDALDRVGVSALGGRALVFAGVLASPPVALSTPTITFERL